MRWGKRTVIASPKEKSITQVAKLETNMLTVSSRVFNKRTKRQKIVCIADTEEKFTKLND